MDPLLRLREWVRGALYRNAASNVLVVGDSHIRVFEHWWFLYRLPRTRFDIVYVPGATATGVGNRRSRTDAYRIFSEVLASGPRDLVLLHLGEVDTAYTLWKKVERDGGDLHGQLSRAVRNYCNFIKEAAAMHELLVLSACLPTLSDQALPEDDVAGMRKAVRASQQERTALALEFNRQIAAFCDENSIAFLSLDKAVLGSDGVVSRHWLNQRRPDHHYARWPYARLLAGELKGLITLGGAVLK